MSSGICESGSFNVDLCYINKCCVQNFLRTNLYSHENNVC